MDCYAQQIFSIQSDFFFQKSPIEEKIIVIKEAYIGHRVIYYPQFYCDLNHIEYFWYDEKSWTWRHYKHTIEKLREDVPIALSLVKSSIILGHNKSCFKKIDLYRKKVVYGIKKWKKLTFYKKI